MTNSENEKGAVASEFLRAREGEQGWKIRYGAEPIDLHLSGKGSRLDKWLEATGITAGPGGAFNHNYIEILNPVGEVVKRVHGIGLEPKDGKLEMTGGGRLVGLAVDGKHTKFSEDPIQRDDPHSTLKNQLQHASAKSVLSKEDYTKTVFQGTEREVMGIYGAMLRGSLEINNQGIKFDLLRLNSNTFNAEMKEKANQMAEHMGLKIPGHDAPGSDIGFDPDKIQTSPASPIKTWESMEELREDIGKLEQASNEQWKTLKHESLQNGQDINSIKLNTMIPNSR